MCFLQDTSKATIRMSTLTQEGIIEAQHAPMVSEPTPAPAAMNISAPTTTPAIVGEAASAVEKKGDSKLYSRRLLIHTNATYSELAAGKAVKIADAEELFKPDFNTKNESEIQELKDCDLSRGIISKVEVMSCYNNANAPVILGLKLFSRNDSSKAASYEDLRISNENGWLYSCATNSLGEVSSKGRQGVTNVFSMMPYERMRQANGVAVYTPSNILSNRYIQQYGGFDWRSLWSGIVQFPSENYYYVSKDHVILRIIEQNWELLGMDVRSEIPRENKYVKVACNVADRVIKELYSNVISRIPFTKWKNMAAVFSSDHIDASENKSTALSVELRVSFMYPSIKQ